MITHKYLNICQTIFLVKIHCFLGCSYPQFAQLLSTHVLFGGWGTQFFTSKGFFFCRNNIWGADEYLSTAIVVEVGEKDREKILPGTLAYAKKSLSEAEMQKFQKVWNAAHVAHVADGMQYSAWRAPFFLFSPCFPGLLPSFTQSVCLSLLFRPVFLFPCFSLCKLTLWSLHLRDNWVRDPQKWMLIPFCLHLWEQLIPSKIETQTH